MQFFNDLVLHGVTGSAHVDRSHRVTQRILTQFKVLADLVVKFSFLFHVNRNRNQCRTRFNFFYTYPKLQLRKTEICAHSKFLLNVFLVLFVCKYVDFISKEGG